MKRILLTLVFVFLATLPLVAQEALYPTLTFGKAEVQKEDPVTKEKKWVEVNVGERLPLDVPIRVPQNIPFVEIEVGDNKVARAFSGSMFILRKQEKSDVIKLTFGKVFAKVEKLKGGESFEVNTDTAIAAVRGTKFGVKYESPEVGTKIVTLEGSVAVSDPLRTTVLILEKGKMVDIPYGVIPTEELIKPAPEDVIKEFVAMEEPKKEEIKKEEEKTKEEKEMEIKEEKPQKITPPPPVPSPSTSINQTQTQPSEEKPKESKECGAKEGFNFGWSVGSVTIGDNVWTQIILNPTFRIGKFGIGLYLSMYWDGIHSPLDPRYYYNSDEWDFRDFLDALHDLLLKILFLSYGEKGDPLFFRIGSIPDFLIGHGFIVDRYSNMLGFPDVRKIGIQFDIDKGTWAVETMVNDIYEGSLVALRGLVRPLYSSGVPILANLGLGLTIAADFNPAGDFFNPILFTPGIDLDLPIINLPIFNVLLFADYARHAVYFKDSNSIYNARLKAYSNSLVFLNGQGFSAGIMGHILGFIPYRIEYRRTSGDFIPNYFDTSYDAMKGTKLAELLLIDKEPFNGWLASSGVEIKNFGYIHLTFQESYGKEEGKDTVRNKLHIEGWLDKCALKKVYGGISYDRYNIVFKDFIRQPLGENTVVTLKIYYNFGGDTYIGSTYKRFYTANGTYDQQISFEVLMGEMAYQL